MHVVIIGNGILGCSVAFELYELNPNIKVTLIGPKGRDGGATSCAGAMLNSFAEIDYSSLKSVASMRHFELSFLATQMWPDFERRLIAAAGEYLPHECRNCQVLTGGCFSRGTYVVNNSTADDLDDRNYDSILSALKKYEQSYEEVDPKTIQGYKPLSQSRAQRGLLIHDEGWLNPKVVLKKIDSILGEKFGVNFVHNTVSSLKHTSGKIEYVVLSNGDKIYGDHYLLANGSDASNLLDRSHIGILKQKVYSGVGISLEVKTNKQLQKSCIRTPNRGGACGLYAVPYFWGNSDGINHLLIGASNFIDINPHYYGRAISIAHLLEAASNEINQELYDAEVVSVNVGNRPTTFDQYMLIGSTSIPNLSMLTGTKRDGFHLAPVLGAVMAKIILDVKDDLISQIEIFSPERSPILDIGFEEGIDLNVTSLMSEVYQHGFKPSTIRQHDQVKMTFEKEVRSVHEKVTGGMYGIPPLMYKLCRDSKI
jgi:glycine oxidase